ncbi:tRNA nucleotidyltransferase/poly(A) polymerase family protein [Halomicronema hongdechloris]|uniref:CCA tRNA nucleotidyltransferase n=1 Tax=Halomicronema hongdechloris TaxID=1209493 RepID=UPI001CECB55A|nr:CCA tRNA nucleotidyltransferase [Halomicronema hongdechloris]
MPQSPLTLTASALSPKTWPFELSLLPESAHLVGGSVRDALLGRQADYLDLDFVLSANAVATAETIARHYQAGFVVLDAKHQIARVVFDNATVDFAQQVGPTLITDLHRRDFTVNAIAYHPHSEALLDPLGGYGDLQQLSLRMIAPENLKDDPLRLLRAYRQAAQLGFALDPDTQETIRQLAPLIKQVAAERVRGELDCLLSSAAGTPLLQMAWQDGLVRYWLPGSSETGLRIVDAIDRTAQHLQQTWPLYGQILMGWLREQTVPGLHRSWFKAAKLSQLLLPEPAMAEENLRRLKYSRVEQQAVVAILKGWHLLTEMLVQGLSPGQQYYFFKGVGASFPGTAIVALARGVPMETMAPLMHRYVDPSDPVAHPKPLLTGRDLMQALQLQPGPCIGQLLEALQLAQARGQIDTAQAALEWAADWLTRRSAAAVGPGKGDGHSPG